jgi:hypothetical protein
LTEKQRTWSFDSNRTRRRCGARLKNERLIHLKKFLNRPSSALFDRSTERRLVPSLIDVPSIDLLPPNAHRQAHRLAQEWLSKRAYRAMVRQTSVDVADAPFGSSRAGVHQKPTYHRRHIDRVHRLVERRPVMPYRVSIVHR